MEEKVTNMDRKAFQIIRKHLYRGELGVALNKMTPLLQTLRNAQLNERQQKISHDHQLIIDYLRQGVNDPQRDELYAQLLRKADVLAYNIETQQAINDLKAFSDAQLRIRNSALNLDQIKPSLEQFVGNVALLEFEPAEKREELSRQIYQQHHDLVSCVFDALWISEASKS